MTDAVESSELSQVSKKRNKKKSRKLGQPNKRQLFGISQANGTRKSEDWRQTRRGTTGNQIIKFPAITISVPFDMKPDTLVFVTNKPHFIFCTCGHQFGLLKLDPRTAVQHRDTLTAEGHKLSDFYTIGVVLHSMVK